MSPAATNLVDNMNHALSDDGRLFVSLLHLKNLPNFVRSAQRLTPRLSGFRHGQLSCHRKPENKSLTPGRKLKYIVGVEYYATPLLEAIMAATKKEFGEFARKARLNRGITLREAARRMNYSASYLSRVESGDESASPKLIAEMSKEYGTPIESLMELAPKKSPSVHGHLLQDSPELRALYRVGSLLDAQAVEQLLRALLADKLKLEGEELERKLRDLKDELPRLRQGSEGLLAANVRPRVLSRQQIGEMAENFLFKHGFTKSTYTPPTPIEWMVDQEQDIRLRVADLDRKARRKPYVLGLSRWASDGNKEIILNSRLVESDDETSEYRLLFTLGHELFHTLQHLPLMNSSSKTMAECCRTVIGEPPIGSNDGTRTVAQRAVKLWCDTESSPRKLSGPEDWREWQAQTFAASILMPEWAVRKEFRKITGLQSIQCEDSLSPRARAFQVATENETPIGKCTASLNRLFKVSGQAMAIRLLTLKLVASK